MGGVYIAYDGDEHKVSDHAHMGVTTHLAVQTLDDIVADMRLNYADAAEVKITIR